MWTTRSFCRPQKLSSVGPIRVAVFAPHSEERDPVTESRLRRSLMSLQELMRQTRHHTISDQVGAINAALRGHYAYYGVAGNFRALVKVYRAMERYWFTMLRSRSRNGGRLTWDAFHQIKERTPLLRPKLYLPHRELQALAVL